MIETHVEISHVETLNSRYEVIRNDGTLELQK